ncbi:Csu type fimbrial protein [Phyllobacterium lublinensis]|uniref:Csu type fimbrial protein n=1 Tax=Phyllobacterium lublinensis TaxID=2875708 RepID=UPI00402687AA
MGVAAVTLMAVALIQEPASAASPATGSFSVKITINSECKLISSSDLDFGSQGVLNANVDATSNLTVQCTPGTSYNVGLGAGAGTIGARHLTGPGNTTIDYNLYRDPDHTQVWGTTILADTVSKTGDGTAQLIPVYGRVAPQATTPPTGNYSDTIDVTVTY